MRRSSRADAAADARQALEREVATLRAEVGEARADEQRATWLAAFSDSLVGEFDVARVVDLTARHATLLTGRPAQVLLEEPGGDVTRTIVPIGSGTAVAWLVVEGTVEGGDRLAVAKLAELAGRAMASAQSVQEQGGTMRTLERSLLPEAFLPVPGLALANRYIPASTADVGGDFYDAVRNGETVTLIVGDVQGKGVEAATLTSLARHTLRSEAFAGRAPAELLLKLNEALLYGQDEQMHAGRDPVLRFVTAAVARLTPDGDEFDVVVARAGQPPPLIVRSAGTVEALEPRGVLLGVNTTPTFVEQDARLHVGDTLVLYTDGVIEQRSDARQPFSEQHLGLLVRNRRSVVDAEAIAQLIEDTVGLMARDRVRDDVAVLVACATGRRESARDRAPARAGVEAVTETPQ